MSAANVVALPVVEYVREYPNGAKRCPACNTVKPVDEFGERRHRGRTGVYVSRQSSCRACHLAREVARYHRKYASKRRPFTKRTLVVVPAPVSLPKAMPERGPLPIVEEPATCVCGALRSHHRNFKGGCPATGCAKYFERGL